MAHEIDEIDLDLMEEPENLAVVPPSCEAGPCGNSCVFCYIKQNPPEVLREHGGNVDTTRHDTLNDPHLEERVERARDRYPDLRFRIVDTAGNVGIDERRVESLAAAGVDEVQISLHTTVPETRKRLMGNPNADELLELLPRFEDVGIDVIADLVLTPGYNLRELPRTCEDLETMGARQVRVFPVGGTDLARGFRFPTRRELEWMRETSRQLDRGLDVEVVPSPTIDALLGEPAFDPPDLPEPDFEAVIVVGELAAPIFEPAVRELENVELLVVKNRVFGGVIGASSLLTARDVLREIERHEPRTEFPVLILPDAMFDPDGRTLDGWSREELVGKLAALGYTVVTCRKPEDVAKVLASPSPW
ncbi:DUF512 domain-containing protein [Methanopyrus sp.]